MDSDIEKYEKEWRELRGLKTGELLKRKFVTQRGNDYSQYLLDMEFDRRKMNRDMWVSRWISFASLLVAIVAVTISLAHKVKKPQQERPQTQAQAIQSEQTNAAPNNQASIPQFPTTNTTH